MRLKSVAMRPSWLVTACAAALLLGLWAVYRVAFDAPFYFDTRGHLLLKSNLHMDAFTWQSVVDSIHLDFGGKLYRPIPNFSLAVTYLFYGLEPRPYRIGNVFIHWGASLAALFLFLSVLETPRIREGLPGVERWALPGALGAAVLWSLHPIQTNAVTYVIQRMASLCGLFSFVAVGAYLRSRASPFDWSWRWGLLALAAFSLALGSKENAITLLLLVPIAEYTLLSPFRSKHTRRVLTWTALAVVLIGASLLVWKGAALWAWSQKGYRLCSFTLGERLLTEARLQSRYLLLLLVPDPRLLTLDAQVGLSRGVFTPPSTAATIVMIALSVVLATVARRRHPLLSFGIFWFLATQAAEATVLPLELYYEHRMYVPSAVLYLGVGVALARWASTKTSTLRPVIACLLLASATGAEAWATHQRNTLWADPVAFWSDAVEKAPERQRCYLSLGEAFSAAGDDANAAQVLEQGLLLPGNGRGKILTNLAAIATRQGNGVKARERLEAALEEGKNDRSGVTIWFARRALAALAFKEGRMIEAQAHISFVLAKGTGDGDAWNLQGAIYLRQGQYNKAEDALRKSLRFEPRSASTWNNLGVLSLARRDRKAARAAFARACALRPEDSIYRRNLSQAEKR